MKRVLNSGSINLAYVQGTEEQLFRNFSSFTQDEALERLTTGYDHFLKDIWIRFDIKAPLLLLSTFQRSNLGLLETFPYPDPTEVYLPPQFYKEGPSGYTLLNTKDCNDLNTKYSNFYRNVVNFYNNLLEKGVCKEEAQLVLPSGLFTIFHWTVNAKDLISFIEKNYSASPEMYGYCSTFVLYLEETIPLTIKYLKKTKWAEFSTI